MSRLVVFEDAGFVNLLPLVYWRGVGELRCGRYSLAERAARVVGSSLTGLWCREELAGVAAARSSLAVNQPGDAGTLLVNARWLVTERVEIAAAPSVGLIGETVVYVHCDAALAGKIGAEQCVDNSIASIVAGVQSRHDVSGKLMHYPWDLVAANHDCLVADLDSGGTYDGTFDAGAHALNPSAVHVAAGARIKPGAVLDAENGPIMIDNGAEVSPNAVIQGPAYIGPNTLVQPGAVIRESTSIGPVCKVGGEIEGTIIHGHSNKQHDGFLGHAYIAEWCNLGADTVNSDLKNTYGSVRVEINGRAVDSGSQFVGLFMGDHSKTGINQAFSTGAVVGFGCSVATSALPPKFVPSFSWLTDAGRSTYDMERCLAVAKTVMARRKVTMSDAEVALFRRLPEISARHES